MSTKVYNKLVRDGIPAIIEADGKTCITEILSEEAYIEMLDAKLNEELKEYQESKEIEELADLLEVMQAIVKARGYSLDNLEQIRQDKADKRGGFEKRILLKEVKENIDYSFLLEMKDYLIQRKLLYSNTFPHLVVERKQGRQFSFEEHVKGFVYSQLSAQTQWHRIVPHLKGIDELFHQYDYNWLASCDMQILIDGIKNLKCGSRCTAHQMSHIHQNLEKLKEIEREYGSLDAYVTSKPATEIVKELSSGRYKLAYIGEALAWEYLRNVGIDGAKPDVHICRFSGSDRMNLCPSPVATTAEVEEIMLEISKSLNLTMVEIDSIIWSFCATNYGEICTATPKCNQCIISKYCKKR